MLINKENIIWITWERHRRTAVLANELEADLYVLIESSRLYKIRLMRYLLLSLKTLLVVFKRRPRVLIVQNPSIILSFIACILKFIFKYTLVVDRHSNFKFHKVAKGKWKIFHFLSKFTIKNADITIVTNRYLADVVTRWGGDACVLPDRIPELFLANPVKLTDRINIVYVCSFSDDEPIVEVLDAARGMDEVFVYITGDYKKSNGMGIIKKSNNIQFTGFLDEDDYQDILCSADLILVLTTQEYTLTCGAYEAVSLCKPMILSNTSTIRGYFYKGAIYCDPTPASISAAIKEGILSVESLEGEVTELKQELQRRWLNDFEHFKRKLAKLAK